MTHNSQKHVIVAVGASAGGLDALNGFFDTVPAKSAFSYVIIQHLSPNHKSYMAELLSKKTKVPIVAVEDDEEIKPNHIYVIPPSQNLEMDGTHLRLKDKPTGTKLNLPINMFFESLAKEYKEQAVGIVLSGTGSDGTNGIQSIKEHGGLVIIQDPKQAKFNGMPNSAINTGLADFIIPVEQMNSEIVNYYNFAESTQIGQEETIDESAFQEILEILKKNTHLDFSYYKRPTLIRRIARRIRVLKLATLRDYLDHIRENEDETEVLYKDFLIGVTNFFRDAPAWDILREDLIPRIVRNKSDNETIKIWDVACSTGQETYSLGMLFKSEIEKQQKSIELKIFATDISKEHIEIASKACYNESVMGAVSPELREKFFEKDEDKITIKSFLRKDVIFSEHNILKDPPFKNMDLVVCRNLLIYLKPEIQQKVLHVLHYALIHEGILFLGSSENLGGLESKFETIDRKYKFFENVSVSQRLQSEVINARMGSPLTIARKQKDSEKKRAANRENNDGVKIHIGKAIAKHFGAASVYLDGDFKVIDAIGSFSKYAKLPEDGFSLNFLNMLPEELSNAVKSAARKAKRKKEEYAIEEVIYQKGEKRKCIDLIVTPKGLRGKDGNSHFIVTLLEREMNGDDRFLNENAQIAKQADARNRELLEEIEELQEELKKAVEKAEASTEELQTLNEELLASNEELQSTNEELQSVNEELHTVNAEHVQKMEDLALLNSDMDNLLDSTSIATIFLDRELTIRKFTPSIEEHFSLFKQDVGRPLSHFLNAFGSKTKRTIVDAAQAVLDTGKSQEKRIKNKTGKAFLRRITPFVNENEERAGVVITFIDITRIEQSQEKLKQSEEKFKSFYEDDPVMHISLNPHSGLIIECNNTLIRTLGYKSKKELIGKPILDFYSAESKIRALELLNIIQKTSHVDQEEMVLLSKEGKKIPVILNSELIYADQLDMPITRSTLVDISELKIAQKAIEEKNSALERANMDLEQFVSICSHDLQEPLGTIRFSTELVQKMYKDQLDGKGQEYLQYVYDAAGRMADQIKGLLQQSRIGENAELEKVNIKELLEVVKYDLTKRLKEVNGAIHIGRMPTFKVYKTEMRLLFQNLIGNALKYSKPEEPPVVRVSSYKEEGYWVFAVTDNGIGIKEEDIESIFTIFGRAGSQDKYEGTGVGLAHVEKIVKLHKGAIWVESQFGIGSTFYFKIKS